MEHCASKRCSRRANARWEIGCGLCALESLQYASKGCSRRANASWEVGSAPWKVCSAPAKVVHGAQMRVGKLAVRHGKLAVRRQTLFTACNCAANVCQDAPLRFVLKMFKIAQSGKVCCSAARLDATPKDPLVYLYVWKEM